MLQNNKLEIYPTSRAIREQISNLLSQNTFLPKYITIGDFEKKALLVPARTFIDEDTKVLLMQEASNFSNFTELNIDREFFSFLKNSKYLFSFFEELAVELVDISELKQFDTYANYDEHLEILQTLREKYITLLDQKNYVDKMTLPSLYKLNEKYIRSFAQITLHLEGYLSRFELKLFEEIAEIVPFHIHLHTNQFNQKMIDTFAQYGFSLQKDHAYILDFTSKEILESKKAAVPQTNYIVDAKESATEQIAFIKKKLYDFIQKGYAPEEIIIILPKAASADLLDLFDHENNFNFAMGFSFTKTEIYKKLDALYLFLMENNHENYYRLENLKIPEELLQTLQKEWNSRQTPQNVTTLLTQIIPQPSKADEAYQHFYAQLQLFAKLLPAISHYPLHKIFHLFLNRLSQLSIDDTRGGKVTVLEILETRGISKEAVIVIDFNEGVLPATSKKDLFLSSSIREACKLPTPKDRENLQKYYYSRIFDQAKDVAICYLLDEQNQPSRFLQELDLHDKHHEHGDLKEILFPPRIAKPHFQKADLIQAYDFSQTPLSSSGLKTFLDCKRKYYFQYIQKLKEFEIPKEEDDERIVGILLHEVLKTLYTKQAHYLSEEDLLVDMQRELYLRSEKNASLRFVIDKWLEILKPFISHEVKRFQEGFRVYQTEKKFDTRYNDLHLTGTIDRIDQKENAFFILDYKSGKIPQSSPKKLEKESNFQLQFYYLLTQNLGDIQEAYYYGLKDAKLQNDTLFDEKLELLYTHLDTLGQTKEFNFVMTEDLSKCTYCPYSKICNRIK